MSVLQTAALDTVERIPVLDPVDHQAASLAVTPRVNESPMEISAPGDSPRANSRDRSRTQRDQGALPNAASAIHVARSSIDKVSESFGCQPWKSESIR